MANPPVFAENIASPTASINHYFMIHYKIKTIKHNAQKSKYFQDFFADTSSK